MTRTLKLRVLQNDVLAWYRANARGFPWRRTRNPYRILVAEVMLQQTQTARVVPAYRAFLKEFPSAASLARATPGDVIRAWKGLGYNRRAVNLHRAAQAIVARGFPRDVEGLRHLPGVGEYTAAAVAAFAFGIQVPVIDTNVRRVLGRAVLGVDDADVREVARAWLPNGDAYDWNQALMDVGAVHCHSTRPSCEGCPFKASCAYRRARPLQAKRGRPSEPFVGSSRQRRGDLVNRLRAEGSIDVRTLSVRERESLDGLEKDGLVVRARGRVRLP